MTGGQPPDAKGSPTLAEFERSLSRPTPPNGLVPALRGLWWAAKDDWDRAHKIVMDETGADCAWVHAYLHRRAGDLANARYWYAQAGRPAADGSLETEWRGMADALLAAAPTA
jgi:hypothetical protein